MSKKHTKLQENDLQVIYLSTWIIPHNHPVPIVKHTHMASNALQWHFTNLTYPYKSETWYYLDGLILCISLRKAEADGLSSGDSAHPRFKLSIIFSGILSRDSRRSGRKGCGPLLAFTLAMISIWNGFWYYSWNWKENKISVIETCSSINIQLLVVLLVDC